MNQEEFKEYLEINKGIFATNFFVRRSAFSTLGYVHDRVQISLHAATIKATPL